MKFLLGRIHRSASAWSFFATMLRVGANVFVLPLVLRKLPADQFGVWVVFGTIGGLAALMDLGFEFTITRMTSYAWGGAARFQAFGLCREDKDSGQQPPNLVLLRDLIATLKAYYFYVGLGMLVLLAFGGGTWVWIVTRNLESAEYLELAWIVYAGGCCLNFIIGRWSALLTGVGAVRQAQQATIISQLFYYGVVISGLLMGWGIWALVAGYLAMGVVARHQGKKFFVNIVRFPGGLPRRHFHREMFNVIWPNAWRTGLVSIGAYLSLQVNTLICSAFLGLKVTAAYGLSFQLVNLLFGLCSVWIAVKLPTINALRLNGSNDDIASLFAKRMRLSLLSYLAGALVIIFAAPLALQWLGSKTPLISTPQLAVLLAIRLFELHQAQYAFLILTENHNPFLKPSLISGVAITLASLFLTPLYGVWGLLLGMGIVNMTFNNWWPVLRGVRGLNQRLDSYFIHHFLRPKAWLELF